MKPGEPFNPRFEACGFHPEEIVARRRDLTAGQKLLYDRLINWARSLDGDHANQRAGEVWRSQDNIATELGKSSKQVCRDIAKLESVGLLGHRIRHGRKSNTYFFLFHPDFQNASRSHGSDRTSTFGQTSDRDGFERTSESVQTAGPASGRSDLSGHPRPVTSSLNGRSCPPNQQVVNQQLHTHGGSRFFGNPDELAPRLGVRADSKTLTNRGGASRFALPEAGWESPKLFEDWWTQLLRKHPNRNRNAAAKVFVIEPIQKGTLKRHEFEDGTPHWRPRTLSPGRNRTADSRRTFGSCLTIRPTHRILGD
jgi:hypothetical protein